MLEEAIKDRINKTGKKPKAIILVYLYGMPAKICEIKKIADKYEIPLIEDAAEGLGSRYDDKVCGTFGKYGVFSFNGNKMITTSGGGALVCPDEETKKRVMFYATQARESYPYYQHEKILPSDVKFFDTYDEALAYDGRTVGLCKLCQKAENSQRKGK